MPGGVTAKICGLSSRDAVTAAVDGGAALIGFVFFPPSPRNVSPQQAAALAEPVPRSIEAVGVMVDPTDDQIETILNQISLKRIQLHGAETIERVGAIKHRFGLPVIKAIAIGGDRDLAKIAPYEPVADWLMFDAKPPQDLANPLPGGNAVSFDWSLLADVHPSIPWMLSGGLTSRNLAEAVSLTGARMVDVSSGVEDRPGHKDPRRIGAFLNAARAL